MSEPGRDFQLSEIIELNVGLPITTLAASKYGRPDGLLAFNRTNKQGNSLYLGASASLLVQPLLV